MNSTPVITESEWRIMKRLWEKSPQTSSDLISSLSKENEWSDSTIKTLLSRLVKKKAIAFEKTGKVHHYRPLMTEKRGKSSACRQFLDKIFGGSLTPMIQHFVEEQSLSKEEVQLLQKLLSQKKKS
jgi:BlaI family penicillinase repressor